MTRSARLQIYLRRKNRPFVRGLHDCCTWADGWAEELTGAPVAADLFGKMSTREALRILRRAGGMGELVGRRLTAAGWIQTDTPQAGDLVVFPDASALGGEALGIWTGNLAVALDECGHLRLCPCAKLRAWHWPGH